MPEWPLNVKQRDTPMTTKVPEPQNKSQAAAGMAIYSDPRVTSIEPISASNKFMDMMQAGIEAKLKPEELKSVMEMYKEAVKFEAEMTFRDDFAQMQAKIPPVQKTQKGQYGWYAPIDEIGKAIAPLQAEFGLSYRWENKQDMESGVITSTCIVTHRQGHSERSTFVATVDRANYGTNSSGNQKGSNDMQRFAAAQTFANRRSLSDAFGITTTDSDTDGDTGNTTGNAPVQEGAAINASHENLCPKGKYKGVPWSEVPPDYIHWASENTTGEFQAAAIRAKKSQTQPKKEVPQKGETKADIMRAMLKCTQPGDLETIWAFCPIGLQPQLKESYDSLMKELKKNQSA